MPRSRLCRIAEPQVQGGHFFVWEHVRNDDRETGILARHLVNDIGGSMSRYKRVIDILGNVGLVVRLYDLPNARRNNGPCGPDIGHVCIVHHAV